MKIAVMGAMREEIEPLLDFFKEYREIEYAQNRYYEVHYNAHTLYIAYSKIGKVNAALSASALLQHFGCEKLLFTGVAGAINPDLKIGDLIYATKVAQHDLDITAFGHPFGYVPEGKVYVESSEALNTVAKEAAKEMGLNLRSGTIATGDQFIANEERKEWIAKTFEADAIEMEGAAVAVVCDALDVPFFILRSISDSADMDASFSFESFLESSSRISAGFVIKMAEKL